jgi:hypothetical protein
MHNQDNLNPSPKQSLTEGDIPLDLDFPDPPVAGEELQPQDLDDTDSPQQSLKKLYNLVGNCVVVPIPYGEKGPRDKEWQNVTFDQSLDPTYQNRIYECFRRGGNLGILLGPGSYNLVDIDIDLDERVEPFLDVNPKLRETFRRKGKRGCGLLIRIVGQYPIGRWDLKLTNGAKFGEWRAGGGHQSVVFGRHPETNGGGKPIDYKVLIAKHRLR